MPLATENAGAGCLLPEDVDLEAVSLRGEDDRVVDAEQKPVGELAPSLDESDALAFPL